MAWFQPKDRVLFHGHVAHYNSKSANPGVSIIYFEPDYLAAHFPEVRLHVNDRFERPAKTYLWVNDRDLSRAIFKNHEAVHLLEEEFE